MRDKIDEYVNTVCQQMRWKKARQGVAEEMTAHIEDGRDFYMAQGMNETDATAQSITDTGDATILGANFDRVHRPKPQWGMLAAVAAFLALGIVLSQLFPAHPWVYNGGLPRRLLFTGVGVVIMFAAYFADFSILGKFPKLVWGTVAMLFVGAIFSIWHRIWHRSALGTSVWLQFPLVSRTSQLALTLLLPLLLAVFIFSLKGKGVKGLLLSTTAYVGLGFGVAHVSLNTGLFHFAAIGMAVLLVAILKNWFDDNRIISGLLLFLLPVTLLIPLLTNYHTMRRLFILVNPNADPRGEGFVGSLTQSMVRGAAFVGQGSATWEDLTIYDPLQYLPSAASDSLLTSVLLRFGWLPTISIIAGLLAFIVYGYTRCFKQKSGLGFFVSFAIMSTFALQTLTYVTFNLGFTLTQIALPFISPGNTVMVVNLGLLGFMLSVFRTGSAIAVHENKGVPARHCQP